MRYIGGKSNLLTEINDVINEISPNAKSVIDLFSGSGSVADSFKQRGYSVICNDQLYFSYVLLRGITQINEEQKFDKLPITNDPIQYLNELTIEKTSYNLEDCFIYQNYSPHDNCTRMYFTPENAKKIDIIRLTIEDWYKKSWLTTDEYYYLLASLISAVPYVSNIAGVYAAYLKHWDKRATKPLILRKQEIICSKEKISSFNYDCNKLLKEEGIEADVLYSDSPYNSREYLPNYHILETIAKYDYPIIKGVSGMREYEKQKSDFCNKGKASLAFERMIRLANVKYVVISYNNEGLVSTKELTNICEKYAVPGTFKLKEIPYRRYKSKIPNEREGLVEQIYSFEKKKNVYVKSPMNYTGGKYKLLPQIDRLFPDSINTAVDLFCGGCDVAANILAKKVYANDINWFVVDIFKEFKNTPIDVLLSKIDGIIREYSLSKENKEGYAALRKHYNSSKSKDPVELYVLVCHSFNYQFRFNSSHEYNNTFGNGRSSFNETMRKNLIQFKKEIDNIVYSAFDYREFNYKNLKPGDFVYVDPPYLITTGSYNDGKRGFDGWSEHDDLELFSILDSLDSKGVNFALSNVFEHKGLKNEHLIEWSKKYNVHYLNYNYANSNYHAKNTDEKTVEVLITNY